MGATVPTQSYIAVYRGEFTEATMKRAVTRQTLLYVHVKPYMYMYHLSTHVLSIV